MQVFNLGLSQICLFTMGTSVVGGTPKNTVRGLGLIV